MQDNSLFNEDLNIKNVSKFSKVILLEKINKQLIDLNKKFINATDKVKADKYYKQYNKLKLQGEKLFNEINHV